MSRMPVEVKFYILLFFISACLGWCMEVICKLIQLHRFINRGFLIGPCCPIYGFGAVSVTLLLSRFADTPPAVFGLAILVCGTLEYLTSAIMEKLFHARWRDYSRSRFHLNGRVCAETLLPFGPFSPQRPCLRRDAASLWTAGSDDGLFYQACAVSAVFLSARRCAEHALHCFVQPVFDRHLYFRMGAG